MGIFTIQKFDRITFINQFYLMVTRRSIYLMIAIGKNPIEKKVYAYILKQKECQYQLLIFEHLDFPEAGVQIPGGTVESGKSVSAAALREIQEETGLKCINLFEKFGVSYHDMSRYGLQKIHERHYFHFDVCESTESAWMGYEETPSDGSPGPISLKFYWVNLDCVPLLAGRTDEILPELIDRLKLEAS